MDIDEDKIDDVVLALLWLTRHDGYRAWKGFDWATTDRLFKKGMIDDPVNKSKSLILTEEGLQRSGSLRACMSKLAAKSCRTYAVRVDGSLICTVMPAKNSHSGSIVR